MRHFRNAENFINGLITELLDSGLIQGVLKIYENFKIGLVILLSIINFDSYWFSVLMVKSFHNVPINL